MMFRVLGMAALGVLFGRVYFFLARASAERALKTKNAGRFMGFLALRLGLACMSLALICAAAGGKASIWAFAAFAIGIFVGRARAFKSR